MLKVEKTVTGTNELTLEVAKSWMRIDHSDKDTLITLLIDEAKELIETYINYTLTPATITLTATARTKLFLPYGPVQSITSVKDTDGEDVTYTYDGLYIDFAPSVYSVTAPSTPYVQTTTIYTTGTDSLPAGLLLSWKEVVLHLYENRGDVDVANLLSNIKPLQQYRHKIWI